MKTQSINKITVAMILAVMMIISVFGIITLNNAVSAEGIQPLGIVITGDATGDGTYNNKYTERPWNGRIVSKDNVYDNYYIEINVDPRNSMFGDDIIIEYKYYYVDSSGKRVYTKLQNFYADIRYHETKNGVGKYFYDTINKDNDDIAGFTKHSGSIYIDSVEVDVTVTASSGIKKHIYYKFYG